MVHAAGIDSTHTSRARALVSVQLICVFKKRVMALSAAIGVAVHLNVLYIRKVCLVKLEINRVTIMAQRSTDEFCSVLSVTIRLDKFINAHVRLESGLYAIEVFECDSGKFFHGHLVILFVRLVEFHNRRFQMIAIASAMESYASKEAQIIVVPLDIDSFSFQTDDGFVLLDVCRQRSHVYKSYWVMDDTVYKKVTFVCCRFSLPRTSSGCSNPRRRRKLLDDLPSGIYNI